MKTENHRVLIIDDERPVLMTLEALLKRHGYQVETAPTGAQGLKVLKSKSPTLVLLDLRLPDADGLEMLDRIKTELPNVQVIILTAHDSLHNAIEFRTAVPGLYVQRAGPVERRAGGRLHRGSLLRQYGRRRGVQAGRSLERRGPLRLPRQRRHEHALERHGAAGLPPGRRPGGGHPDDPRR